jgi:hypothetical protein
MSTDWDNGSSPQHIAAEIVCRRDCAVVYRASAAYVCGPSALLQGLRCSCLPVLHLGPSLRSCQQREKGTSAPLPTGGLSVGVAAVSETVPDPAAVRGERRRR